MMVVIASGGTSCASAPCASSVMALTGFSMGAHCALCATCRARGHAIRELSPAIGRRFSPRGLDVGSLIATPVYGWFPRNRGVAVDRCSYVIAAVF